MAHLACTLPRFVPCVLQSRISSMDIGVAYCFLINTFAQIPIQSSHSASAQGQGAMPRLHPRLAQENSLGLYFPSPYTLCLCSFLGEQWGRDSREHCERERYSPSLYIYPGLCLWEYCEGPLSVNSPFLPRESPSTH